MDMLEQFDLKKMRPDSNILIICSPDQKNIVNKLINQIPDEIIATSETDNTDNIDYVFVFNQDIESLKKQIYVNHAGIFPFYSLFERQLEHLAMQEAIIVVDKHINQCYWVSFEAVGRMDLCQRNTQYDLIEYLISYISNIFACIH